METIPDDFLEAAHLLEKLFLISENFALVDRQEQLLQLKHKMFKTIQNLETAYNNNTLKQPIFLAFCAYFKGTALSLLDHREELQQAQEFLQLSVNTRGVSETTLFKILLLKVKLNPKFMESWNVLGEILWNQNKYNEAKDCLLSGMKFHKSKNKVSLRKLSIVLRNIPTPNQQAKILNISESLKCAKEAVALDTDDGTSWCKCNSFRRVDGCCTYHHMRSRSFFLMCDCVDTAI